MSATTLQLRDHRLEATPSKPLVMGILNATPDSFSDGAQVDGASVEAQVERGLAMRADGADLIDVGGESSVTDRAPVDASVESARVVPLVERLAAEGIQVSVDTWKADVARAALDVGASMINDVSGLRDPAVADACAASGAALVVMHTRAAPKEKSFPGYSDATADVLGFLRERIALALERGVGEEQIVADPGPDFAKTPAETVEVLRRLGELTALGRPLLLAVSRKDFVGALTGRAPRDRLAGTLAAIGAGCDAGASIVRVHDVRAARDYLDVRAALRGETAVAADLRLDPALRRQTGRSEAA
ncbi:MAG: dihydropteroate synthase [Thermoleophilaceae bacterium]|nr:dihydropteroate synthase [Thermoleophilaceae bacterium]